MKKKAILALSIIIFICVLMYAEYRFIMTHQCVYKGNDNNTIYIEIFDNVDEYYVE